MLRAPPPQWVACWWSLAGRFSGSGGLMSKPKALGCWTSTIHLLSSLVGPSSPASILQLLFPSLPSAHPSLWGRRGFGCSSFGDRSGQSTAVLQWWGQRSGVFWDMGGAVSVSSSPLSLWAGGGLTAQPIPTGDSVFLCAD